MPVLMDINADSLHLQKETLEMQHAFETDKTFGIYACNMCMKHIQHPDKISATWKNTYYNIRLKQLKHLEQTIARYVWKHMQHLDKYGCNIHLETDEIFWTNACNTLLKHLQHMQHVQHTTRNINFYDENLNDESETVIEERFLWQIFLFRHRLVVTILQPPYDEIRHHHKERHRRA